MLILRGNSLKGQIPGAALAKMELLENLDLAHNELAADFPVEFASCQAAPGGYARPA